MKLVCTLPMPPSMNNAYPTSKSGKRFPSNELKQFKRVACLQLKNAFQLQCAGSTFYEGQRFALHLRLHFKNKRRCDIDNRIKAAQDALSEALGFDDARIDRLTVERGAVESFERCELILTDTFHAEEA